VITTSSYEARAFGVKTGMNTWEARQKCPALIFVVGDNRKYTWTSKQIVQLMLRHTPLLEVFSIDEAFLDVTGSLSLYTSPQRIAHLLKAQIRHRFGITCSIGIAPNKLLAKLASDMDEVNNRYGDFSVTFASLLDNEKDPRKGSHVISPAWRPEGIRNVDVK
jgi:DNA polymerase-4